MDGKRRTPVSPAIAAGEGRSILPAKIKNRNESCAYSLYLDEMGWEYRHCDLRRENANSGGSIRRALPSKLPTVGPDYQRRATVIAVLLR
jgi:hypothetical protein